MPLVRIDLSRYADPKVTKAASEAVYDAMVSIAKVPANDKFQIITRHNADELIYPSEGYLGIEYSPGIIFIQITWVAGRTTEVKKAFFKAIADSLHEKANVRREDVFISLVDAQREDWSFGGGLMQYAPPS